MNTVADSSLSGKVVLVTRPVHQQAGFIQLLQQSAAEALPFPAIEILPVTLNERLKETFSKINEFDLLIFVSANAVKFAVKNLQQLDIAIDTIDASVAVIGSATRTAARKAGFRVNLQPEEGFNSEALMQLPALQSSQVESSRVLIIRGIGGLEDLAKGLMQRGASVSYAEVYQRAIPATDGEISRDNLSHQWDSFRINTITVTSNEALNNLYDMLESPGRDAMLKVDLIVPSQRCFSLARSLGFQSITTASSATNQQMIDAIMKLSNGK